MTSTLDDFKQLVLFINELRAKGWDLIEVTTRGQSPTNSTITIVLHTPEHEA